MKHILFKNINFSAPKLVNGMYFVNGELHIVDNGVHKKAGPEDYSKIVDLLSLCLEDPNIYGFKIDERGK